LAEDGANGSAYQRTSGRCELNANDLTQRPLELVKDGEVTNFVGNLMEEHCSSRDQSGFEIGDIRNSDCEPVCKIVNQISSDRDNSESLEFQFFGLLLSSFFLFNLPTVRVPMVEVMCCNLLKEEERDNSNYYHRVNRHICRIVSVSCSSFFRMIMVMPSF